LARHRDSQGVRPKLCGSGTVAVDSMPEGAGPYGHLHLAGNVWERVSDRWHPRVYSVSGPRVDPSGGEGEAKVLRGGDWSTFSTNMRVSNRFHDLVMGSAIGFRCARGDATPTPDKIEPLQYARLRGTVVAGTVGGGKLSGRALYVTAFETADLHGGVPIAGRSPVAEVRLVPTGDSSQPFALLVPQGGPYAVSAALDTGKGRGGAPASGSGGVGQAAAQVTAHGDLDGIVITLAPLPSLRRE
jgi:hypothetical protein